MQGEWDAAAPQEVDRLRQQMPTLDPEAAGLAGGALRHAGAHGARPRARGGRREVEHLGASDQRLARELQQNELIAALARHRTASWTWRATATGGRTGHDARNVRSHRARRPVRAAGARRASAPRLSRTPAQAAVALDAFFDKREVQVARFDAADFAAKVNADRRRTRGLLQGATRRSSRRRSRRASNTWCSTSTR